MRLIRPTHRAAVCMYRGLEHRFLLGSVLGVFPLLVPNSWRKKKLKLLRSNHYHTYLIIRVNGIKQQHSSHLRECSLLWSQLRMTLARECRVTPNPMFQCDNSFIKFL